MPTFTFSKPIEDVEEPVLLEEDWYRARIYKEPALKPNKAMQKNVEDEKAGFNLEIPISLTNNTVEAANGRKFVLYVPWPMKKDEDLYDSRGMKQSDAKMERVAQITEGFGGTVDGTDVVLEENMEGYVFITQGLDQQGQNIVNNLDLFSGVKSIAEAEGEEGTMEPPEEAAF